MNREEFKQEWNDLACGIALLYMGKDENGDEYTTRLKRALEEDDFEEIEHVTALMLTLPYGESKSVPKWVVVAWGKLSRIYHNEYCQECLTSEPMKQGRSLWMGAKPFE